MKPSDKVVCIDDGPCRCCGEPVSVTKGQIYTVESTFDARTPYGNYLALVLVGIVARPNHRRGINSNRFRHLSEVQMIVSAVSKNKTYEPTLIP